MGGGSRDYRLQRIPTGGGSRIDRRSGQRVIFNPASVWEVAIKNALGKPDFHVDPHVLRRALPDNGYIELPITSEHTAGVANLPNHHKDPFDRLLVAQATAEGITLLTNDATVAAYTASPVRLVQESDRS